MTLRKARAPKHPRTATRASVAQAQTKNTVRAIYETLARAWGRQHWWPAETPFEVITGAILTQNTSWTNVERALANLRAADLLNVEGIRAVPLTKLQKLIRSSGYFRQKAQRLKNFVAFLDARYGGSLEKMFATPTEELRAELLTQNGIGPETADSILLYAGHHEVFVVDAYTRRIFERHRLIEPSAKYDEIRALVERALEACEPLSPAGDARQQNSAMEIEYSSAQPARPPVHSPSAMSLAERSPRAQVYNEMHGLLVQAGKHYCLKQEAKCELCPLEPLLPGKIYIL